MTELHLIPVGRDRGGEELRLDQLDVLAAALARVFHLSCHVRPEPLEADFALDPVRGQYHSTAILRALAEVEGGEQTRLLGVTAHDLFIPVLTFVFGEAQLGGRCAVVSLHRLREEFYGLPPDAQRLQERLAKEAIHELAHTFGLRHCDDWRCVMASSHSVERLDLKGVEFCLGCCQVYERALASQGLSLRA